MNEIEVKKYELPKLEIKDYEVIKEMVEKDNKKYKRYVVTKDTLEVDTKKRAELRKQAKAIDDRRKEIEKEISAPIKEFKTKCDVLKKMYEESADLIDVQIKVFEEKQKEKKKKVCIGLYEANIGELQEIVSFEKIFNDKWLNKGTKEKEIETEIKKIKETVENGLEAIKNLNSEFETELINTFLEDFDLTKAILKNTQLQENKEAMKNVVQRQEEVRSEKIEEMLTKEVEEDKIDPIKTYNLQITAPLSKQKKLKEFLELNKMEFKKIGE